MMNPYAPPCYNGINDSSPPGFRDVDYTYILDATAAAGGTTGSGTVFLNTDSDADFIWRGLVIIAGNNGQFAVRFSDGNGYFLCNELINSLNLQGDGASPFPISPGDLLVPKGVPLRIDVETPDQLSPVYVEFQFRGVKRWAL